MEIENLLEELEELRISDTLVIRELKISEAEQAFPIISQLRPHLSLDEYISTVKLMEDNGYKIICVFGNGKIVSYAGFARLVNLYYGEHIWVYDLITDENERSKGYGRLLLAYIEEYAKSNRLNCVALSSGIQREDAHRFYEIAMDYERASYVFVKRF